MAPSTVAQRMLWTNSAQVATFLRLVTDHEQEEAERIGRLIAHARKAKGWNQQDLANKLDVHVSTAARWEQGRHEGIARNRTKLAEALDLPPALLRPTEPALETQLDRIETMLGKVYALLNGESADETLTPEEEVGRLTDEVAEVADEQDEDQRGEGPRRSG